MEQASSLPSADLDPSISDVELLQALRDQLRTRYKDILDVDQMNFEQIWPLVLEEWELESGSDQLQPVQMVGDSQQSIDGNGSQIFAESYEGSVTSPPAPAKS